VIDLIRAGGVDVQIVKNDASDPQSVMEMIQKLANDGHNIRGVIHAAGITADAQFDDIDSHQIAQSSGPKLKGAHYLVDALDGINALEELQFLLFTSSVSSVVGILIQGTYAAANAGLDGLAESLRNAGVNATAMQLGPIDSGGMASDDVTHRYLSTIGLGYVSPRRLCGILDLAVAADTPHFVTEEIDWTKNGRGLTANVSSSLLKHIIAPAMDGNGQADLETLLALDPDDRSEVLSNTLIGIVSLALGIEESHLTSDSNFSSMGVDSLSIMEVQAGLNETLQMDIPLTRLFTQDGTIGLLARQIAEYLEENFKKTEES
jgi:NAD(P)-dependent dehydrogenase (short-subunit alcohol dehydrogenase family)/acyl carrier protein